jgi:uncharacterized membrane protein
MLAARRQSACNASAGQRAVARWGFFSTFVMRGLDRTGPVDAITAMRGINAEANSNPAFLLGYFGAAILAPVVGVMAVVQLNRPGSWTAPPSAFSARTNQLGGAKPPELAGGGADAG